MNDKLRYFFGAVMVLIGFAIIGKLMSWDIATGVLLIVVGNNLLSREMAILLRIRDQSEELARMRRDMNEEENG